MEKFEFDLSKIKSIAPISPLGANTAHQNLKVRLLSKKGTEVFNGDIYGATIFINKEVLNDDAKRRLLALRLFKAASHYDNALISGFTCEFTEQEDLNTFSLRHSPEALKTFLNGNENRRKPLVAFDLKTGKPINAFPNVWEAKEWLTKSRSVYNCDMTLIIYSAKTYKEEKLGKPIKKTVANKMKSYRGYRWAFYEDIELA